MADKAQRTHPEIISTREIYESKTRARIPSNYLRGINGLMRSRVLYVFIILLGTITALVVSFTLRGFAQEAPPFNEMVSTSPTPRSQRPTAFPKLTGVEIPELPQTLLAHNDLRSCTKSQKLRWLALIEKHGAYNLERPQFTYGPWKGDAWCGSFPVHYMNEDKSEFIFEDNGKLKVGPVETLFTENNGTVAVSNSSSLTAYSPPTNPISMIRKDDKPFKKTFVFENTSYTIESATVIDSHREEAEALMLENGSVTQAIRLYEVDQHVLGDIAWLGDIDRDRRLDMLIRYYPVNGDGITEVLYISSLAKTEELVAPYATYFPLASRQCPQAQP